MSCNDVTERMIVTIIKTLNVLKMFLLIFRLQEYYNDFSEAKQAVQNAKLSGLIYFSHNFSEALQIRIEKVASAKDSDLLASQIQIFLDMGGMLFIY